MSSSAPLAVGDVENEGSCGARSGLGWVPALAVGALVTIAIAAGVAVALGWVPGAPVWGPYPVFWPIVPFGFFVLLLLVFFTLRWRWRGRAGGWALDPRPRARDIVRERYARGEISREQLRTMLEELGR